MRAFLVSLVGLNKGGGGIKGMADTIESGYRALTCTVDDWKPDAA